MTDPVRVLEAFQPEAGGVAEHAMRLTLGLRERGHDVEVALSPGAAVRPALEEAGVVVHPVEMARAPGAGDVRAARKLRGLAAEGGYDVVHAHSSKAGALVRLGVRGRGRIVYTPHCFAFAAEFAPVKRQAYRAAEQALLPLCGRVIACSEWELGEARRQLAGAERRIEVVRNGVPPCAGAAPDPGLVEFAAGRPLAGMVAELREQKDPLALVRAAALTDAKVAVVGNGPLQEAVQAEIATLGIEDRVRLFPFEGDVGPYLSALDVFVLPSLWESLPLAILEAMACGLPVVAARVGGVGEAVEDGRTGVLVEPRDPAALATAIGRATPAMGAAGRERATKLFGLDRMVEQTAAVYAEVAA